MFIHLEASLFFVSVCYDLSQPFFSYSPFHHIMMQHGCTADWLLTSLIEFKHRTHNDRSKDALTLAVTLIYTKPAKTTYNLCL